MTFPDPRILFNAYPNSTAPNPANGATLNFIGSSGFLCRPDMATEIDPNSGITYRTEIENAIEANYGFFPLDTNPTTDSFTTPSIIDVPSMTENGRGLLPGLYDQPGRRPRGLLHRQELTVAGLRSTQYQ